MTAAETLTPLDWAAWVLIGDPSQRIPDTLKPLADRIVQAIRQAIGEAQKADANASMWEAAAKLLEDQFTAYDSQVIVDIGKSVAKRFRGLAQAIQIQQHQADLDSRINAASPPKQSPPTPGVTDGEEES